MASNFRISRQRSKTHLHLRLIGDFDGVSAHQLLDVLKRNIKKGGYKVIIHTGGLKCVYPFGRDTFQSHIGSIKRKPPELVFVGVNAGQIAPH